MHFTGKPVRQAYYFDLEDKIIRTFASKVSAEAMTYGTSREIPNDSVKDRELRDCWDGTIIPSLFPHLNNDTKKSFLYFAQSHDGVEIQKNVTYTPITAKVLNLPTHVRGRLGCIWLLGYLPPHVKNYQNMLKPMVEMFAKSAPDKDPINVYDAHTKTHRNIWTVIAWITNDIRAVPNGTCGRHPPSLIGSCNYCCIQGTNIKKGTTVLVGAVGAVKRNHRGNLHEIFVCLTPIFVSIQYLFDGLQISYVCIFISYVCSILYLYIQKSYINI